MKFKKATVFILINFFFLIFYVRLLAVLAHFKKPSIENPEFYQTNKSLQFLYDTIKFINLLQ